MDATDVDEPSHSGQQASSIEKHSQCGQYISGATHKRKILKNLQLKLLKIALKSVLLSMLVHWQSNLAGTVSLVLIASLLTRRNGSLLNETQVELLREFIHVTRFFNQE